MGIIISKIEEVDRIRWVQLRKGRVVKAKRVLAVTEQSAIIELEDGTYTVAGHRHSANGNWAVLGYGLDRFTGGVLDGLVRLGILTKDQVAAHKAHQIERQARQRKKYALDDLEKACATLGIPVPPVPERDEGQP